MGNPEKAAEAWRNRELAEKLVGDLGPNDRIKVHRRIDPDVAPPVVEETYTCYRPPAELTPFFLSGDCAAIKQAIDSGLLEPTGDAMYRKAATRPSR